MMPRDGSRVPNPPSGARPSPRLRPMMESRMSTQKSENSGDVYRTLKDHEKVDVLVHLLNKAKDEREGHLKTIERLQLALTNLEESNAEQQRLQVEAHLVEEEALHKVLKLEKEVFVKKNAKLRQDAKKRNMLLLDFATFVGQIAKDNSDFKQEASGLLNRLWTLSSNLRELYEQQERLVRKRMVQQNISNAAKNRARNVRAPYAPSSARRISGAVSLTSESSVPSSRGSGAVLTREQRQQRLLQRAYAVVGRSEIAASALDNIPEHSHKKMSDAEAARLQLRLLHERNERDRENDTSGITPDTGIERRRQPRHIENYDDEFSPSIADSKDDNDIAYSVQSHSEYLPRSRAKSEVGSAASARSGEVGVSRPAPVRLSYSSPNNNINNSNSHRPSQRMGPQRMRVRANDKPPERKMELLRHFIDEEVMYDGEQNDDGRGAWHTRGRGREEAAMPGAVSEEEGKQSRYEQERERQDKVPRGALTRMNAVRPLNVTDSEGGESHDQVGSKNANTNVPRGALTRMNAVRPLNVTDSEGGESHDQVGSKNANTKVLTAKDEEPLVIGDNEIDKKKKEEFASNLRSSIAAAKATGNVMAEKAEQKYDPNNLQSDIRSPAETAVHRGHMDGDAKEEMKDAKDVTSVVPVDTFNESTTLEAKHNDEKIEQYDDDIYDEDDVVSPLKSDHNKMTRRSSIDAPDPTTDFSITSATSGSRDMFSQYDDDFEEEVDKGEGISKIIDVSMGAEDEVEVTDSSVAITKPSLEKRLRDETEAPAIIDPSAAGAEDPEFVSSFYNDRRAPVGRSESESDFMPLPLDEVSGAVALAEFDGEPSNITSTAEPRIEHGSSNSGSGKAQRGHNNTKSDKEKAPPVPTSMVRRSGDGGIRRGSRGLANGKEGDGRNGNNNNIKDYHQHRREKKNK